MNTSIKKIAFIFLSVLLVSSVAMASDGIRHHKSSPAIFTILKLTPRQFSKGIQSERNEYKSQKQSSYKKMMKRRHGGWFKRWYHRNF